MSEEITEKKEKVEKKVLSPDEVRKAINKKTGHKSAFDMTKENPAEVKDWIPSGNRLLDSIMCDGMVAGIPVGRIIELAAEPGGGKSFLAVAYAKNALLKGYDVVYFCSEPGGVEADFLTKFIGVETLAKFTYVEVNFMEEVFETIESLLVNTNNKYLFVWDSYAATPAKAEADGGFDPSSTFAIAPRVATLGLRKLLVPLAKRESTLLVLNQIRDNIGADKYKLMYEPYRIPGGKGMAHAYSNRLWLFVNNSKAKSISDEGGEKIGKTGKVIHKKSRHGTEGREAPIAFTWSGDHPHLHNEELWMDALKERKVLFWKQPRWVLRLNGAEIPIKLDDWETLLKDVEAKKLIMAALDEAYVYNYQSVTAEIPRVAEED